MEGSGSCGSDMVATVGPGTAAVITVNEVTNDVGNVTISAVARRIASLHGGINADDQGCTLQAQISEKVFKSLQEQQFHDKGTYTD